MIDIRQNKGFALAFSMIFLFLIISFVTIFFSSIFNSSLLSNRIVNDKEAYNVAEAGLADAYVRIIKAGVTTFPSSTCANPNIPSTCGTQAFIPSATTDNGIYTFTGSGQTVFTGNYTVSIQFSNNPIYQYIITSAGTFGGITKTLQLTMISAAISKYIYWSNSENNLAFGPDRIITGPVQTNGTISIAGNPQFLGPVTTSGASIDWVTPSATNESNTFMDGLTLGAPPITPPLTTLNTFLSEAGSGGLILTGATTITFNNSGTINITNAGVNGGATETISPPANGVIYVQSTNPACQNGVIQSSCDGNATINGTVSGRLTVVADQNIYISGSVMYNDTPVIPGIPGGDPNSTDVVGLVANNNITILSATSGANLQLDGTYQALNGGLGIDNTGVTWGNNPGTMDVFGSIDNAVRQPIGSNGGGYTSTQTVNTGTETSVCQYITFNGMTFPSSCQNECIAPACTQTTVTTTIPFGQTSGYIENQTYDLRLAKITPPGFLSVNSKGIALYTKLNIQQL